MAYIDDLNAPRPGRRKPAILGAISTLTTPAPAPTTTAAAGGVAVPRPPTTPAPGSPPPPPAPPPPVNETYGGQSPVNPDGTPNTGYTGNTGVNGGAQTTITPPRTAANNPGLDPAKWLAGHTSPKYAFHEVAKKYDQRTDAGRAQTLAELQRQYPQWFNNWTIAGDKLRYAGDMNALHGDWDGYNEFDAWEASGAGVWRPQWMPTQRNGQAYVDPGMAPASSGGATGSAAGGGGTATGAGGGSAAAPFPGLGGSGGLDFGITGEYGYDDPNSRQLEEFLRMLIDEKVKPIDDPARTAYATQMWDAINELTNPALTENDRSRLENRALEPMERDRQIRLQQQKERMGAMGHGASSGTIVDALSMVDQDFDRRRGEVQRDLSIYDREQQDARRRESLTMGEALATLSGQQRSEQDARMREALTYVSLFPEMDERRLRLAMETLGMSNSMSNAPSIFNTLSNLQAQANASAQQGQQANAQFWGQMGQWMANAWPKDGGA